MEISSLSPEYFDTKKFFHEKDKKLREKGYVVDRYGRPIRKRKMKRSYSMTHIFYLLLSIAVSLAFLILLLLVYLDILRWGKDVMCVPGFDFGICERTDFLDSFVWQMNKNYDVNGEVCSRGVAFRVWAPKATSIKLMLVEDGKTKENIMKYDLSI